MRDLQADDLINGYRNGIFPMADADGTIYWYAPEPRAIIPISSYKPPKSLRPILNKKLFEVRINTRFEDVMRACAIPRSTDDETWISEEIVNAYTQLHQLGMAFSVEAFRNDQLVGGLYGVSIGSVFFGESMFYREANASKVAFHYLMEILKHQGYYMLDTQFINDNVRRYGAVEVSRADYMTLLRKGLSTRSHFVETALQHFFKT